MKRYELLILEWDLGIPKEIILREEMGGFSKGGLIGAGLGAGVGMLSAGRNYLKKRAELQNQMAECQDDQCRQVITAKLGALKAESIRSGLGRGAAGAAIGGVAGAGVGTGMQMAKGVGNMADMKTAGVSVRRLADAPNPTISRPASRINALDDALTRKKISVPIGVPLMAKSIYDMGSKQASQGASELIQLQNLKHMK